MGDVDNTSCECMYFRRGTDTLAVLGDAALLWKTREQVERASRFLQFVPLRLPEDEPWPPAASVRTTTDKIEELMAKTRSKLKKLCSKPARENAELETAVMSEKEWYMNGDILCTFNDEYSRCDDH